jgi:hypothetical protein
MTRLTSTIFAVALLAGCVGDRSLMTGQPCPCAPGWSCDEATNTCFVRTIDASISSDDTGAAHADATSAGDHAGPLTTDAAPAVSCACDTTKHMFELGQSYVTVSRDCFCASPFGYLCRDFDQAAAELCSRPEVHAVSASRFEGCTLNFLQVTIGSVAKGRPTHATLKFVDNAFDGAMYEADLVCNNLPADEANDSYLNVVTDDYNDPLPMCGGVTEWNACTSDADAGTDVQVPLP